MRYSNGELTITMNEVISYAESAIATLDSKHPTRSGKRTLATLCPIVEQSTAGTRSGNNVVSDTTMYIANFTDSMGYVVISADVLTHGPIAIIERGSLASIDQASNNAALNLAIRASKAKKQTMLARQDVNTRAICNEQKDHIHDNANYYYKHSGWTATTSEAHLRTSWTNYVGFANYCSRIKSCDHFIDPTTAAPALAQLAYYYKIKGNIYTWNVDMERFRGMTNIDFVSDESIHTIRTLYADIFNSVKTIGTERCTNSACPNHGITNASWDSVKAKTGGLFKVSSVAESVTSSNGSLKRHMQEKRPVLMSGYSLPNNNRQYWVADGYALCIINCDKYNRTTGNLVTSDILCCYPLTHCVMGVYEGNGDGYYDFGDLSNGSEINPAIDNYASDIKAIFFDQAAPAAIN